MPKFNTLDEYLATLNAQSIHYYNALKDIFIHLDMDVKERLFAGQLAFYIEANLKATFHASPVVIIAFFKDHLNVFASGNLTYKSQLTDYSFTEKGTMKIPYDTPLNYHVLSKLFYDSLQ